MIYQETVIKEYDIIFSDNDDTMENLLVDLTNDKSLSINEEFISILHPEDARWFYRSTELSKYNILRAFNGYDSLRLETKFQELSSFKGVCSMESENEKIVVKNNLFEVDVRRRTCIPIYWTDPDDEFKVYRGTWFLFDSHLPLMEALADTIESQHYMNFGSLPCSSFEKYSKKTRKALHTTIYADHMIIWYSPTHVYLYENKSVTKIMKKLKISAPGRRIYRGYKEKALFEDRPTEITHICFVVHGIGQKLAGKINQQCHKLKSNCKRILKTHFLPEKIKDFRIEFIPIEWRSGLNLDGGIIDSITPQEFKGLRTIFNSTIMDILYYSSSLYRSEMTQGLESELNRLYSMFCSRNPYFEDKGGKISILAHSLGSVICYDIIKSWITPNEDFNYAFIKDPLQNQSDELLLKLEQLNNAKNKIHEIEDDLKLFIASQNNTYNNGLKNPNLPSNFKNGSICKRVTEIDNFFTMGSPLPVFLALRGLKPRGMNNHDDILPSRVCKRIFNIFHPSDPVAYRLEPLIMKEYVNIKPVHIEPLSKLPLSSNSESQINLKSSEVSDLSRNSVDDTFSSGIQQTTNFEIDSDARLNPVSEHRPSITEQISESLKNLNERRISIIPATEELKMKLKNLKSFPFFKRFSMFLNILKGQDITNDEYNYSSTGNSLPQNINGESLLENRLDFTIGDERSISSFLSLFTAHTSYWEDIKLVKFLLDHVLSDHKVPTDE